MSIMIKRNKKKENEGKGFRFLVFLNLPEHEAFMYVYVSWSCRIN